MAKRLRSPAYPGINLKVAINRATELYQQEHTHAAEPDVVLGHWKYSKGSGPGSVTLAALKHFGLLVPSNGDKVKLSELALSIIQDEIPDSKYRTKAIKKAALQPKVFADLASNFGMPLPSDPNIRTYLIKERKFNPKSVADLIKDFRDTLVFAMIDNQSILSGNDGDSEDDDDGQGSPIKVGDLVQWTVTGVAQWHTKRRVISIIEFDGKQIAQVEAGDKDKGGNVPIEQLSKNDAAGEQRLSMLEPILDPAKAISAMGQFVSLTLPRGVTVSIRASELLTANEREKIKSLIDFSFSDGTVIEVKQ